MTHLPHVPYICASEVVSIVSGNVLPLIRRQAITWTIEDLDR